MGISGMMRTGVSGMNAQGNRLSAVADNVANSSTVGYKRADAQFSSLVVSSSRSTYQSGGINTHIRYNIQEKGISRPTMRANDAMIAGNGFFRVQDSRGGEYLTRAGSFQRDKDGYIVNSAGYYLLDENGSRIAVKGGSTGMMAPEASSTITMALNLNANAKIISEAFDHRSPATYNQKKSVSLYDLQGAEVKVDIYMTKTANNTWRMDVMQPDENGDEKPLITPAPVLEFNDKGELKSPTGKLPIDVIGGAGSAFRVDLDMGAGAGTDRQLVTQQGSGYSFKMQADGMTTGFFDSFTFSDDGQVMVSYSNGITRAEAVVGLTTVAAPDMMTVLNGTVFQANGETGEQIYGHAGEGVFGMLQAGVLEEANADMGSELTDMIEAQRSYTANSKVFQTGSELMDVIVNLKR